MIGLKLFLKENRFSCNPILNGPGNYYRFKRGDSSSQNGWLEGDTLSFHGKTIIVARFGDWKTGEVYTYRTQGEYTDAEEAEIQAEIEKMREACQAEKERYQEVIAEESASQWQNFSNRGTSPYLHLKGIKNGLHGCKLNTVHGGEILTIVPMRDVSGKLWSYQTIQPTGKDTKSDSGVLTVGKRFKGGGRVYGNFHTLGDLKPEGQVFICEGIATAASIHTCTGTPTVAAFNSGNLGPVARALRDKYPALQITIAGDDDRETAGNPGKTAAIQAARDVEGVACFPHFPPSLPHGSPLPPHLTDFNDLHSLLGSEVVCTQLATPHVEEGGDFEEGEEPRDSSQSVEKSTKPKKAAPREIDVVQKLISAEAPNLILQGKRDLFHYTGTHWKHIDPTLAEYHFKRKIDYATKGHLRSKDIQSHWNRFLMHVPMVPPDVNLFAPHRYRVGFKNGTLFLNPGNDGNYTLTLKPHAREDYIINCHPFDYEINAPLNEEFEASVERVLGAGIDPDFENARNAYFEVLGAALASGTFRKLVFFVGPPKTGKSTLILFAVNMVHEESRCTVDPTQFHGFNLSTMVGKLLNYDTDIRLSKPLTDSVLKKIEDHCPHRIERKGLADISAPLPGIHIFGANGMPQTVDGAEAYARRMLVFDCRHYQAPESGYIQDYAQIVWAKNPSGIVRRAMEGLGRLAGNRGHFTATGASKQIMETWYEDSGTAAANFLQELEEKGQVITKKDTRLIKAPEGMTPRKEVFSVFCDWFEEFAPRSVTPTRNLVYAMLRQRGVKEHRTSSERYFVGFQTSMNPDATC